MSNVAKKMKYQIKSILALSSIALLTSANGYEETPLPLGASDLVSDQRFDQYQLKETKIEPVTWIWDSKSVELIYEGKDSSLGEFKFADQWSVAALQVENQKLKERVTDLELRLSKIEGLLTTKERTSRGDQ